MKNPPPKTFVRQISVDLRFEMCHDLLFEMTWAGIGGKEFLGEAGFLGGVCRPLLFSFCLYTIFVSQGRLYSAAGVLVPMR